MKDYHEYKKQYIGGSDIAALILVGIGGEDGLVCQILDFGGDGGYDAYIVDEDAEIGSHYELVGKYTDWLKIYDDQTLVKEFDADLIEVYRAGEFGCVIKVINKPKEQQVEIIDELPNLPCDKKTLIEKPIIKKKSLEELRAMPKKMDVWSSGVVDYFSGNIGLSDVRDRIRYSIYSRYALRTDEELIDLMRYELPKFDQFYEIIK